MIPNCSRSARHGAMERMIHDYTDAMAEAVIPYVLIFFSVSGIGLLLRDLHRQRTFPSLPSESSIRNSKAKTQVSVSIVIPARNEERTIARSVNGALAQQGFDKSGDAPTVELIVVDDGSEDGTAEILASLVASSALSRTSNFRVIKGRPLPVGWVGKCNACAHGASVASGDWLLFLDADAAPNLFFVAALMQHVADGELDACSVWPFQELGTLAEQLVIPTFSYLVNCVFPLSTLSKPDMDPAVAMANGQCIFIRRSVYEAVGGHGSVCGSLLEDVHLARVLRRAGYPYAMVNAREYLHVRMYQNLREVVQGFAKNAPAGSQTNAGRTLAGFVEACLTTVWPPVAIVASMVTALSGPTSTAILAVGFCLVCYLASLGFWRDHLHRVYRLDGRLAFLTPAGLSLYLFIAAYGFLRTLSGRGVYWKGRRVDQSRFDLI